MIKKTLYSFLGIASILGGNLFSQETTSALCYNHELTVIKSHSFCKGKLEIIIKEEGKNIRKTSYCSTSPREAKQGEDRIAELFAMLSVYKAMPEYQEFYDQLEESLVYALDIWLHGEQVRIECQRSSVLEPLQVIIEEISPSLIVEGEFTKMTRVLRLAQPTSLITPSKSSNKDLRLGELLMVLAAPFLLVPYFKSL